MRPGSERWHVVAESEHAHEREGLAYVRELLPDRAPFHAWTNFEFVDANGTWSEVDLLVLGEGSLYLLELKHYQGEITGNAYRWELARRSEESPLEKAAKKARRLKSVLQAAARRLGLPDSEVPYVKQGVFLHAANTRCLLPTTAKMDLYGLEGREHESNLPSIANLLLEPQRDGLVHESSVVGIINAAGFAQRRAREVGSWRLAGPALDETDDWQDWPAEHRVMHKQARIRFFTIPRGASQARVTNTAQLARREYDLTSRLNHPGILSPQDIVEDELGSGLVFPRDPRDQRLDLWLADHGSSLELRGQVALIRQLAEAVQYAHSNRVVHRGLNPAAVLVHSGRDDGPRTVVGGWQVAGRVAGAESDATSKQGAATRLFGRREEQQTGSGARSAEAYVAPEGRWMPETNRSRLDVFALGGLAYLLVTGRDPATSGVELKQRLERERGLDLAADLPQVSDALRGLVLGATNPVVSERLRDVGAFLEKLSSVERELGAATSDIESDPLDAPPGTLIGERFELVRRLGSGSTAVGLLVKDRQSGDEARVLKVALDDTAARRLDAEAEVLTALRSRRTNRVVRILETSPLQVGGRRALLLESAGDETLADVLRDRRRLSLDLLERWGSDLLEALVSLDAAGVDHRDIKPANLGVREQRSDRARHLVLFDFSLARASAATISAGTPPYLDPFLGTGARQHWDSAAERYAAAVTLFEMATGHAPVYGDGETAPQFVERATIEPGDFDPAIADTLVRFFEKALARDARQRHGTAAEMLKDWQGALATSRSTTPEDADEVAERATPATLLPLSGLTPRALSALEPFRLETVGDLATLDTGRLSQFAGIVDATKREIRGRAKQWRQKFADQLKTTPPLADTSDPADPFTTPEIAAQVLLDAVDSARKSPLRRRAAALLLGLDGDLDPFGVRAELTAAMGVGTQAQALNALAEVRDAWAQAPEAAYLLDGVFSRFIGIVDELDGAAWIDSIVDVLAPTAADNHSRRLIRGMVRAAMDRADDKARGADEDSPIVRRRGKHDKRLLVARRADVADITEKLGSRATQLVKEASAAGEFIVPRGRSVPALRDIWTVRHPPLDDIRLVRLAARLSDAARASASGELYATDMPVIDAVRLAFGSTMPSQRFTVEEIQQLVQLRFPGVQQIPGRPGLDRIVAEANTELKWSDGAYAIPSAHSDTTFGSRTALPQIPMMSAERHDHPATRELRKSVASRSFLALGVPARHADLVADGLILTFGAAQVNVTDVLLDSLRSNAEKAGVPWDMVLAADAAAPGTIDARGLERLVDQSIPNVQAAIDSAMTDAPDADRPVLLTEAAPLARYRQLSVLSRLADISTTRQKAVWLIVPEEGDGGPMLDQVPVPLTYASQFLRLDAEFVRGEAAVR
jgi:serine/threonine protein kinase